MCTASLLSHNLLRALHEPPAAVGVLVVFSEAVSERAIDVLADDGSVLESAMLEPNLHTWTTTSRRLTD